MTAFLNAISYWKIIEWVAECILAAFVLYMLIRPLTVRKKEKTSASVKYELDEKSVVAHLSGAIQIPTISPKEKGDNADEFRRLEAYLEKTYPLLHEKGEKTVINDHALLFRIKGSDSALKPIAFLAHQDVVPSSEEDWEYPPFSGEIVNADGEDYIYGRGALDMKGHMITILEAVEYCLKNVFSFKRDLYLCFGYDEELTGTLGAAQIVEYLKQNNIRLEFLIDEGGVVLDGGILGIDGKIALIGNSEKGYVDFALTATCNGGHSSSPKHPTSIEVLAKAIVKLSKHQKRARWSESTEEMFEALIPYMNYTGRFICVNRKILSPALKFVIPKVNPAAGAVLRTTMAPTMIKGSDAYNTISKTATVNVNCRLLRGDTEESMRDYIQKIVGKKIKVERQPDSSYDPPSEVSSVNTESYQLIAKSINEAFDGLIPAPFPFIAGSDAKFYYPVTDHVYRFSPFVLDTQDAERIHGANERIKSKDLVPATAFFIRVIENANA